MKIFEGNSMDEIEEKIIKYLFEEGVEVAPRKNRCIEIIGCGFTLKNPRNRIIYNPERKFNLCFAVGELLWYLKGSNNCDMITFYNKRYSQFSDNGVDLYGAYGKRIFNEINNQWENIIKKLQEDSESRQAVISIFEPKDLTVVSKDIPCTCHIQYFIRKNKLNCIVTMRSNDIIWGTPYDVFNFTMIQEILANILNVELGEYLHFVGSLHIYERHYNFGKKILNKNNYRIETMDEMPKDFIKQVPKLLRIEQKIREEKRYYNIEKNETYQAELINVLNFHLAKRLNNENEKNKYRNEVLEKYRSLLLK